MVAFIPSIILIFLLTVSEGVSDHYQISNEPNNKVFVENASIQYLSDSTVRAWTEIECKKYCDPKLGKIKEYYEYDCASSRVRRLQKVLYYSDGKTVSSEGPDTWQYVIPNTLIERNHKYLCNKI